MKFVNQFETTVCDIAVDNAFNYVVCGHIHHPEIRKVETENGSVVYMNSGDWIENLTSLEYNDGAWTIYRYADDAVAQGIDIDKKKIKESPKELMASLLTELNMKRKPVIEDGRLKNIEAA